MANKSVKENSFDAAPGGSGGLSYGGSFGTPSGGNTTQNPDKFASPHDHRGTNSPITGSKLPDPPDRIPSDRASMGALKTPAVVSPDVNSDKQDSKVPLNPNHAYDSQVDKIFSKKNTPSPDEIMTGLQYELSQMVKKDKAIAKQTVLKNLKTDPQYYSRLDMLNIDDDKMKVDESINNFTKFSNTKNVLDKMVSERTEARSKLMSNAPLDSIFKEMWKKRHGY